MYGKVRIVRYLCLATFKPKDYFIPDPGRGKLDKPVEASEEAVDEKKHVPPPDDQKDLVVDHVQSEDADGVLDLLPPSGAVPAKVRLFSILYKIKVLFIIYFIKYIFPF